MVPPTELFDLERKRRASVRQSISRIVKQAQLWSVEPTEVVFGAFGGAVGMAAAGHFGPGFTVAGAAVASFWGVFGVIASLLLYRVRSARERKNERTRADVHQHINLILRMERAGAPPEVIQHAWLRARELLDRHTGDLLAAPTATPARLPEVVAPDTRKTFSDYDGQELPTAMVSGKEPRPR